MSYHDWCKYNCGSTDCIKPKRPKLPKLPELPKPPPPRSVKGDTPKPQGPPNIMLNDFTVAGKVTYGKEIWIGKWYKPWTWFSKSCRARVVTHLHMDSVSICTEKGLFTANLPFVNSSQRSEK